MHCGKCSRMYVKRPCTVAGCWCLSLAVILAIIAGSMSGGIFADSSNRDWIVPALSSDATRTDVEVFDMVSTAWKEARAGADEDLVNATEGELRSKSKYTWSVIAIHRYSCETGGNGDTL